MGGRVFEFEFGKMANLADGAVTIKVDDTVLLVTACARDEAMDVDFLPLTVEVQEKSYAAGKMPGGFFKREGRPSEQAILNCRLVDRPLRPLFPKNYHNDTQIAITVLSTDLEFPYSSLGILGASMALMVSDIPFNEPVGACEIGYVDGELVVNPTYEQLESSDLQLTVAGTSEAIMMVEAGANFVSEDLLLEALELAQENNVKMAKLQKKIAKEIGKDKNIPEETESDSILSSDLLDLSSNKINEFYDNGLSKSELSTEKKKLVEELSEKITNEDDSIDISTQIKDEVSTLEKSIVRYRIINKNIRPDNRKPDEIRELESEVSVLPRVHGSSIFRRGETQALGTVTLASLSEKQKLDYLSPIKEKTFMLHYNFPPYSVGESGRFMTSRREQGHGALAERAIKPVLPSEEDWPYAMRVVSDVLSSNGSTSMATVCAGILSLMDGGVPIKETVAGIAMGLILDSDGKYAILSDIQGLEDHLGDMDFKVAGSRSGVTALQMDIKVKGVTPKILSEALAQAKEARLSIIEHMETTLPEPREEVSEYAPKTIKINIPTDKIGMVIGSGGSTIKEIVAEFDVTMDINDDGEVRIGGMSSENIEGAKTKVEQIVKDVEVGDVYDGKVVKLMEFGAFVNILPGKDGLVHVSEISAERVDSVEDALEVGQEIKVIVKRIDDQRRIDLSARVDAYQSGELSLEEASKSQRPGSGGRGGDRRRGGGNDRGRGGDRRRGGGGKPPSLRR